MDKDLDPDSSLVQFKFHPVTGKNISLSDDRRQANRNNPRNYFDAVVYGERPLRGGLCEFEVEIVSHKQKVWSWSIQIGVMQCKAGTKIEQSTIPKKSETCKNHCMWLHNKVCNNFGESVFEEVPLGPLGVSLCDLQGGTRLGFQLTPRGDLSFTVNGQNQGVAARKLYKSGYDLYPVVDVCCSCSAVKISKAVVLLEDLQEMCLRVVEASLHSSADVEYLPLPQRLKSWLKMMRTDDT